MPVCTSSIGREPPLPRSSYAKFKKKPSTKSRQTRTWKFPLWAASALQLLSRHKSTKSESLLRDRKVPTFSAASFHQIHPKPQQQRQQQHQQQRGQGILVEMQAPTELYLLPLPFKYSCYPLLRICSQLPCLETFWTGPLQRWGAISRRKDAKL